MRPDLISPELSFHAISFAKVAASCGDKIVLGGSSMGAASAVYAALQKPEKDLFHTKKTSSSAVIV